MTTTESQTPLIEELFCQGHPLDHVIAVGQGVGWSRADVLAVLRDRQWDLDGSGRLPRSKRVTVPQGLRAARPPAPTAPPTPARRPLPTPAPPARPSGAVFSAIADWADDETPTDALPEPPTAEQPQQQPSSRAEPRPRRAAAILPPDTDAAVARFLAERTVQAPDEQFLTSPALRDAYEAWRVWDGAPAVTPRQFGSALTARYRKKQSPAPIEGVKPMCYHGLAWKPVWAPLTCVCATLRPGESCPAHPFDPSAYKPRPATLKQPTSLVDAFLAHEAAASAALDGETQVIGGAYTAASPRPLPELVEALPEPPPPTGAAPDLLAVGREHPDRRVRAAARAVELAVDALCAALKRVS